MVTKFDFLVTGDFTGGTDLNPVGFAGDFGVFGGGGRVVYHIY